MKRFTGWLLLIVLLAGLALPAYAVDNSRSFNFDLSVNGEHEVHVVPGEVVTVMFKLSRVDSDRAYTMYTMQNEINYDGDFVELVPNGSIVNADIKTREITLRDGSCSFYMNYVSFAAGEEWSASQIVGTFQLKIKGEAGATVLTNNNYKVSLRDGKEQYKSTASDLTLIVSSDCVVHFETNGGTPIEDASVVYSEMLSRPEDPIREGYHLEGWYSDIDLTQKWDFETMPVESNMTLYAKWAEGDPAPEGFFDRIRDWFSHLFDGLDLSSLGEWLKANGKYLLMGLPVLLLLILILVLLGRKRKVVFIVNGGAPIDPIKVKRGETLKELPIPVRSHSVFCGWYKDEKLVEPWYAGVDKVTKRKTKLYAKWM